jgi:nucleoside-diphosphate-sugar epimerase
MSDLVVTGASSFLGRGLLARIPSGHFGRVRALVHRQGLPAAAPPEMTVVRGDLLDRKSVKELVTPGATVIHLAYLATARALQDNLAALDNLVGACSDARVRRLIHCSTAVVAGSVTGDLITEDTPCSPATDYERAKYRLERVLLEESSGRFACAILRPTAVFGPEGRNLVSQARRIARGGVVASLYSVLQGTRRMNLVSVHNVAAALGFLAATGRDIDRQVYIVSDDADPLNNYRDVARILARELGGAPAWSGVALPPVLLRAALRARGRSSANPLRVYSDEKLRAAGLFKPWSLEAALVEFARWVRTQPGPGGGAR